MELDFGRLGRIYDSVAGREMTVRAMQAVCSYSRHMFVWTLYRQTIEGVVHGLERTWEFFGGVPRFSGVDNYPAAIARAHPKNPLLTRPFSEYRQHRGFFGDPCRPGKAQDKPKVELRAWVFRRRRARARLVFVAPPGVAFAVSYPLGADRRQLFLPRIDSPFL